MKLFRNLKIRTKIFIGFFTILILMAVTGFISSMNTININKRNLEVQTANVAPLESLMKVEVAFANVRQTSRGFIIRITSDMSQLQKQEERLRGLLDTMNSSVDSYIQTLKDSGSNAEIISNSVEVKNMFENEFKPMIESMMQIAKTGDLPATVALLDSTNDISTKIYDGIQAIYALTLQEMSQMTEQNSKAAEDGVMLTVIFILASLVLALAFVMILSNSISKPLNRLLGITEDLKQGNLSINAMEATKDEVGILTSNFYSVVETLKSLVDSLNAMSGAHNGGDIDAKIDAGLFQGVYKDVAESVNGMVFSYTGIVEDVIRVLNGISEGRFEVEIKRYPGKKRQLNEAIDTIEASLKDISAEINTLAVAAGNGELSRRGNVEKYKGDWANILVELNSLLDNVVAPIQEASSVLEQISQGNFERKIEGAYKGDFTLIKNSLNKMSDSISSYIREISDVLTRMSNNDFTMEITRDYVGQFDIIKTAINLIVEKLNQVMSKINTASGQVLQGSKQISESSMQLAQGATEQAASVRELSSIIEQLTQQTQSNSSNAKQATDLSEDSKKNAAQGNAEMDKMLLSMSGIKESSNNIAKIIKVIEDIAFQTNLLALNAAVEAARAGDHGKGFAVVAEEVRSLAARSQNAAKETNDLINDSMAKVDEGAKVASNTALSLDTIIRGFERVSSIIGEIASASQEQAMAISEVSTGIDQISQVVQTNSATSEEAASASEELASQSEVLTNMITAFKLNRTR